MARWKQGAQQSGTDYERRLQTASDAGTTRIDYCVLREATGGFSEKRCLLGKGASCRVFRARVYGHPVAVKVFNEDAGDWVSG